MMTSVMVSAVGLPDSTVADAAEVDAAGVEVDSVSLAVLPEPEEQPASAAAIAAAAPAPINLRLVMFVMSFPSSLFLIRSLRV
jgi:hypothetical protein